jgi:ATP/maltotriose-dependent transcriptional regulator MalT
MDNFRTRVNVLKQSSKLGGDRIYDLLPGVSLARITPPIVPPQFLMRAGILELLEKPAPLAVFAIAPSGFGKTITAAQWALMHPDCTIWYTPKITDTFKDVVFHCVQSLRNLKPDAAKWIEKYRTEEFDPENAVVEFCNEIKNIGFTINFVIDGAHKINPETDKFTQLWAELAPDNLKTLTIRNNLPKVTYYRAISIDSLNMLTPTDLMFTDNEIKNLCANFGVDYEFHKENIAKAKNWPAGVTMLLKTLRSGANSGIIDYSDHQMILESALLNLEPSIYETLEKLVYFENFTLEQAYSLLKSQSLIQNFNRLASDGIFVSQSANALGSYSLNEIIRQAMIFKIENEPEKKLALKKAVVDIHVNSENFIDAILMLEEIGDVDKATELVGLYARRLLWGHSTDRVEQGIKIIGKYLDIGSVGEDVAEAFLVMANGTLDELSVKMRGLEVSSRALGVLEKVECDLLVMQSRLSIGLGELTNVLNLNRMASKGAKSLFSLRLAANAAFLMEDLPALMEIVEEARTMPPPNPSEAMLHLPAIEILLSLAEGKMKDALHSAIAVVDETKKVGATGAWLSFDMVYCAAEAMREIGDEQRAIDLIETHLVEAKKFHVNSWVAAFESKLALNEFQMGYTTAALQRFQRVRENLNSPKFSSEIFRVVDEQELIIRALIPDYEKMNQIIYRMPKSPTVLLIIAVVEFRKGGKIAKLALDAVPTGTLREKLFFHILQTNLNLDKFKIAEGHLRKALEIIMDNGFRQILLIQSAEFQEFLLKYASAHPTVYMNQISIEIRSRMEKSNNKHGKKENQLTKREIEILSRLSTGLPISAIAANLHISNNTMKTHLKNAYKKLGANSRNRAVEKARELMLF